ncbi:hypothetical protein [Cupriavidus necator]|uniref:hypothetical protein n=1 Tax=Cupriavidus necator TaxID=106590 RepID=UPI0030F399F7
MSRLTIALSFPALKDGACRASRSVNDDEALRAVSTAFRLLKLVVESGGAASLAVLVEKKADLAGKTVVAICSGGNVDPGVYARALAGQ